MVIFGSNPVCSELFCLLCTFGHCDCLTMVKIADYCLNVVYLLQILCTSNSFVLHCLTVLLVVCGLWLLHFLKITVIIIMRLICLSCHFKIKTVLKIKIFFRILSQNMKGWNHSFTFAEATRNRLNLDGPRHIWEHWLAWKHTKSGHRQMSI